MFYMEKKVLRGENIFNVEKTFYMEKIFPPGREYFVT